MILTPSLLENNFSFFTSKEFLMPLYFVWMITMLIRKIRVYIFSNAPWLKVLLSEFLWAFAVEKPHEKIARDIS